jgi:hypothetical protein
MKHVARVGLMIALAFALTISAALGESIEGLVLVGDLPRDAELIENSTDAEGNYREVLLTADGWASLTLLRQKRSEGREEEVRAADFLSQYYADMQEVEPVDVQPIAAYPTERIRFTSGQEEDQAVVEAVIIHTDDFVFAFCAEIDADAYYGYVDGYEEGDWPESVELWIESLDLFDAGNQ